MSSKAKGRVLRGLSVQHSGDALSPSKGRVRVKRPLESSGQFCCFKNFFANKILDMPAIIVNSGKSQDLQLSCL